MRRHGSDRLAACLEALAASRSRLHKVDVGVPALIACATGFGVPGRANEHGAEPRSAGSAGAFERKTMKVPGAAVHPGGPLRCAR